MINFDESMLISRKSLNISIELLGIFSNMDDCYRISLDFFKEKDSLLEKSLINEKKIKVFHDFSKELSRILIKTSQGDYIYHENLLMKQSLDILSIINEEISHESQENQYQTQKLLFQANIPLKVLNIIGLYSEYSSDFKDLNPQSLFSEVEKLLLFYLKENQDFSSVFFNENNFWSFENMFYKFPLEISGLLVKILDLEAFPLILAKEFILMVLCEMLMNFSTKPIYQNLIEKYEVYENLFKLLGIFLNKEKMRLFHWMPENDIRISNNLLKLEDFIDINGLEVLLFNEIASKSHIIAHLSFYNLLIKSLEERIPETTYKTLISQFPRSKIELFLNKCSENLTFRALFIRFYSLLYIDFKTLIIDNRLFKGPDSEWDWTYEDHLFEDIELSEIIDLLIKECEFLRKNTKKTKDYANSLLKALETLISAIIGCNEEELKVFERSIKKIEELKQGFIGNLGVFIEVFGQKSQIQQEIEKQSQENESTIKEIDPVFKWKRNKRIIANFISDMRLFINSFLEKPDIIRKKEEKTTYFMRKQEVLIRNKEKNLFFHGFSLRNEENKGLITNFCDFFINFMSQNFAIDDKIHRFSLIGSFSQSISNSCYEIQNIMANFLNKSDECVVFLRFFNEFKELLYFSSNKASFSGVFYEKDFRKLLILIDFYRILAKNNSFIKTFLENFYKKKNPCFPFINLLEEFLKKTLNLSFSLENNEKLDFFYKIQREIFELFKELADNSEIMRNRLFPLNPDLCKKLLLRTEANWCLWALKTSVIFFFRSLIQCKSLEIVNFHSTNYEISILYQIFLDFFKQNLAFFLQKSKNFAYQEILDLFLKNKCFSSNELFTFCKEVFLYFKELSEVKSRYFLFFKEREENKKKFDKDELAIFRFFNEITRKIEFKNSNYQVLQTIYFIRSPESYFLSKESLYEIEKGFSIAELSKIKDIYRIECEYLFKKEGNIREYAKILWISCIFSYLAAGLWTFNKEMAYIVWIIELLVSFLGLMTFYKGKYQILNEIYSKNVKNIEKFRLFNRIYQNFLSQKEILLIIHVFCVIIVFLGLNLMIFIDLFSVFRLNIVNIRTIGKKSRNFLISCAYLAIFLLIYMNFAMKIGDPLVFDIVKKLAMFWAFAIIVFHMICPILIDFITKKHEKGQFS